MLLESYQSSLPDGANALALCYNFGMSEPNKITADRLRELLHYDPLTGLFRWRRPTSNRVKVGARAGCLYKDRGWLIRLDGELYRGARLAWLYVKGAWPEHPIEARNDDTNDLRWENLYEAPLGSTLPPPVKASGKPLTAERLRELIDYDAETGVFTRRVALSRRSVEDEVIGFSTDREYLVITVDGKRYRAHRLAWLYVYGAWPLGRLDHEDTDRQNNRIKNLRPASNAENLHNRGKQKNNTSGYKGVSWHKRQKRWIAKIAADGEDHFLGYYDTPEEAHAAYCKAA